MKATSEEIAQTIADTYDARVRINGGNATRGFFAAAADAILKHGAVTREDGLLALWGAWSMWQGWNRDRSNKDAHTNSWDVGFRAREIYQPARQLKAGVKKTASRKARKARAT